VPSDSNQADRVLEVNGTRLEIDPRVGGRITSLRHGDFELLSGPDVDPDNYGSTFWTSPQSNWGWPPPVEIDRAPYASSADDRTLTLRSAPHEGLGIQVVKRLVADRDRRCFVINYAMINIGRTPRTYAPWEVTRVNPGGLTFFSGGSASWGNLQLEEQQGAMWFAHDPATLPAAGLKAFAGGEGGMLAHAAGGFLFVKRFDAVLRAAHAPGEGALEIYANRRYLELEVQGPYTRIEPGDSLSWSVTWWLRALPGGVAVATGNPDLLACAHRAIGAFA
jgi:hypothetical protein